MYSVPQAKHNALKKENERLKELLSEDLASENAKLKARIDELELEAKALVRDYVKLQGSVTDWKLEHEAKIKADAIREASRQIIDDWCNSCDHVSVIADDRYVYISNRSLDEYADQLEQGK